MKKQVSKQDDLAENKAELKQAEDRDSSQGENTQSEQFPADGHVDMEDQLDDKDKQFADKDDECARKLAEKDELCARQLAEKDVELATNNKKYAIQLAGKDELLTEKDALLSKKDREIA